MLPFVCRFSGRVYRRISQKFWCGIAVSIGKMSVVHGTTNEGRSAFLEGFDSFKILSKVSRITEMLPRFVRQSVPANFCYRKRKAVCNNNYQKSTTPMSQLSLRVGMIGSCMLKVE